MKIIIDCSNSKIWNDAAKEWDWIDSYLIPFDEDLDFCLCGHLIRECCIIRNRNNGHERVVGNCCVNKFMTTESDLVFQCINRLHSNITNSLNSATIEYAYRKCAISPWEYEFYYDVMRKRKLSSKQAQIKIRINKTVLNIFNRNKMKSVIL
jgi:hypothetical protein